MYTCLGKVRGSYNPERGCKILSSNLLILKISKDNGKLDILYLKVFLILK